MRYIYYAYGLFTVTIVPEPSDQHGELIGTSEVWHKAKPTTKKFILATLLEKKGYGDVKGITINDCDKEEASNG